MFNITMNKITSLVIILLAVFMYHFQENIIGVFLRFKDAYKPSQTNEKLFTTVELKKYNGIDSNLLYLSILGKVYDVTSGKKHYGPSSNYHIFIGRDASKSFITGEFSDTTKDLDDVLELSHAELLDLQNWSQLYEKQYIYAGKLIGRYYDSYGKPTAYNMRVNSKILKANQEQLNKENENLKYPPCNAEWDAKLGSRVWCTEKSGGIERDWAGVPRMMYTAGSTESRCVCVKSQELEKNSHLKEYEKCEPSSPSCNTSNAAS